MSIKRRKPVIRQIIKENTFETTTQRSVDKPTEITVECTRCGRKKLNTEMISCHNKGVISYECLVKDDVCKSDKDLFIESLEKLTSDDHVISPMFEKSKEDDNTISIDI